MHESVTFLRNVMVKDVLEDADRTKIKQMIQSDKYWFSLVLIMTIYYE